MNTALDTIGQSKRLPGLDALRVLMAFLGVVLHSSLAYMLLIPGVHIPFAGISHGPKLQFFDVLVFYIHSFRMPVFFAISGYFSYLMFQRSGRLSLLGNRLKRIGVPFLLIWGLPVVVAIGLKYYLAISHNAQQIQAPYFTIFGNVGSFWFLYYLLIIDAGFLVLLALKFNFQGLNNRPLLVGLLMAASCLTLILSHYWYVPTDITIVPNWSVLLYYSLFFLFGVLVAIDYDMWQKIFLMVWPYCLLISVLLTGLYWDLFLTSQSNLSNLAFAGGLYAALAWFMVFGLFGLLLYVFRQETPRLKFLAKSTYWVYIIQLPIILAVHYSLSATHLNLFLQDGIIIVVTFGVCLLTYKWFVQNNKWLRFVS